jgi:hypothetical protein
MKHLLDDDDLDYEEEPDNEFDIIGWLNPGPDINWDQPLYILQDIINEDRVTLYNNYHFNFNRQGYPNFNNVTDLFRTLTKPELEDHVHNNTTTIYIFNINGGEGAPYRWKDLPEELKDKL